MILTIGFVGFLLLVVSVTMMFLHSKFRTETVVKEGRFSETQLDPHPKILTMWKSRKLRNVVAIIGVVLFIIPQFFMYARPGHQSKHEECGWGCHKVRTKFKTLEESQGFVRNELCTELPMEARRETTVDEMVCINGESKW